MFLHIINIRVVWKGHLVNCVVLCTVIVTEMKLDLYVLKTNVKNIKVIEIL